MFQLKEISKREQNIFSSQLKTTNSKVKTGLNTGLFSHAWTRSLEWSGSLGICFQYSFHLSVFFVQDKCMLNTTSWWLNLTPFTECNESNSVGIPQVASFHIRTFNPVMRDLSFVFCPHFVFGLWSHFPIILDMGTINSPKPTHPLARVEYIM